MLSNSRNNYLSNVHFTLNLKTKQKQTNKYFQTSFPLPGNPSSCPDSDLDSFCHLNSSLYFTSPDLLMYILCFFPAISLGPPHFYFISVLFTTELVELLIHMSTIAL